MSRSRKIFRRKTTCTYMYDVNVCVLTLLTDNCICGLPHPITCDAIFMPNGRRTRSLTHSTLSSETRKARDVTRKGALQRTDVPNINIAPKTKLNNVSTIRTICYPVLVLYVVNSKLSSLAGHFSKRYLQILKISFRCTE